MTIMRRVAKHESLMNEESMSIKRPKKKGQERRINGKQKATQDTLIHLWFD